MSGNGMLQPSAEACEALARKHFPRREWADLTDTERGGLLDEWHAEQQVEACMAAARHADSGERNVLQFKSLSDLVKQLRAAPAGSTVGTSLLSSTLLALSHELSDLMSAREKKLYEHIDRVLAKTHTQQIDNFQLLLAAKTAEISALREERDCLKDAMRRMAAKGCHDDA
jgi:hypothetical protein